MVVIIDGGSSDKSLKSGVRGVFVVGGVRLNDRCISGSLIFGR